MKRFTIIIPILLIFIAGCTPANEPPLDELVTVGTHSLYIQCLGTGRPTIVIDTGMGESFESWESIINNLSRQTRICAYDRAGYGRSEPGPLPRNSQRAADELHLLLTNSDEDGPFLLVGHSLGGLNMQVYANSYPEEVTGLVLLDPSPLAWMMGQGFPELRDLFKQASQAQRETADRARAASDPELKTDLGYLESVASEFEEFFGRTADDIAAIQSFGELPVTVIGATEPDPGFGEYALAFRQFWNEENQVLARKSTSGRFILAELSSHQIHLDAPQLVIDSIMDLMK